MAATTASSKLEDQAATAALYVTRSTASAGTGSTYLDEDGKLSSAGAATSLKYAKPSDLPSYPSQGGVKLSSAGAAASLAHANQRTFEHWKPGEIPGAGKAAFHAKDYQAPPPWQPEMSSAGSKAAIQAARDGATVNIWQPDETEHGYRAAGQAMRKTGLSPHVERGVTAEGSHRAMLAATGAMATNRRRAESSPANPASFSSSNAAKAATSSQGNQRRMQTPVEILDIALDHSRIHNIARSNVDRQLYTANPPVNVEVEEKNRQDTIHASAVAMAKQMYKVRQDAINEAAGGGRSDSHYAANKVHARNRSITSTSTPDDIPAIPQYTNLQEAAQKLATERLAKLHDEHQAYRNYYGQGSPPKKRLSMRPKARRRASSDSDAARLDEEQSQKIRSEMSLFQDKLAAVDAKKRQSDRDALMAAAQKNVSARMSSMDERVFEDTGKASPAMVAEWEAAAKTRAQADSDARMVNHGKIHIGSGKYLDQSEVDAIARGRLQPTLDDITEKAEAQRAKDEEMRLEEEERKRQAELERVRSAELKAEQKKVKDTEKAEEKARKDLEKSQRVEERKTQKEAEKEEKRTQKDAAKGEKRKSKETADKEGNRKGGFFPSLGLGAGAAAGAGVVGGTVAPLAPALDPIPKTEPIPTDVTAKVEPTDQPEAKGVGEEGTEVAKDTTFLTYHPDPNSDVPAAAAPSSPEQATTSIGAYPTSPTEEKAPTSPTPEVTPTSPTKSGVKGWIMGRFGRRSSRAKDEPGLIGGTILTRAGKENEAESSSPPDVVAEEDSMKEVAMAGKSLAGPLEDDNLYSASEYDDDNPAPSESVQKTEEAQKSPSISSMSSDADAGDITRQKSPTEVSDPPSPVEAAASSASPTSPTSTTKARGRDRIAGFLSKGLGRKLSKRQKEKQAIPSESQQDSTPIDEAPEDTSKPEIKTEEPAKSSKGKNESDDEHPDFEEARDTFDPGETLAPPPKLTEIIGEDPKSLGRKTSGSPIRDSKFSEDL